MGSGNDNVIQYTKQTPVSNNSHILLSFNPIFKQKRKFHILRMEKMGFHHKDSKLEINKEHYYPSFIAKEI